MAGCAGCDFGHKPIPPYCCDLATRCASAFRPPRGGANHRSGRSRGSQALTPCINACRARPRPFLARNPRPSRVGQDLHHLVAFFRTTMFIGSWTRGSAILPYTSIFFKASISLVSVVSAMAPKYRMMSTGVARDFREHAGILRLPVCDSSEHALRQN